MNKEERRAIVNAFSKSLLCLFQHELEGAEGRAFYSEEPLFPLALEELVESRKSVFVFFLDRRASDDPNYFWHEYSWLVITSQEVFKVRENFDEQRELRTDKGYVTDVTGPEHIIAMFQRLEEAMAEHYESQ